MWGEGALCCRSSLDPHKEFTELHHTIKYICGLVYQNAPETASGMILSEYGDIQTRMHLCQHIRPLACCSGANATRSLRSATLVADTIIQ